MGLNNAFTSLCTIMGVLKLLEHMMPRSLNTLCNACCSFAVCVPNCTEKYHAGTTIVVLIAKIRHVRNMGHILVFTFVVVPNVLLHQEVRVFGMCCTVLLAHCHFALQRIFGAFGHIHKSSFCKFGYQAVATSSTGLLSAHQ